MADVGVILPDDLWGLIGMKLDTPSDRSRFRAVCKTWNSLLPFRQPPWLMLAEDDNDEDYDPTAPPRRSFVCLGDHKTYEIDVPELHRAHCVGSVGKWLATTHIDKTICLLNPFSRIACYLPSMSTIEYVDPNDQHGIFAQLLMVDHVRKIVLSSPPTMEDCVVVALHYIDSVLAFLRRGDASWQTLPVPQHFPTSGMLSIQDMIFHKQNLYAITEHGRLMVCDFDSVAPQLNCVNQTSTNYHVPRVRRYLVECSGDLLLVIKFVDDEQVSSEGATEGVPRFQVYKLDCTTLEFKELKNLGDHSLLLGLQTSASLHAPDYCGFVKRNCIYFTNDYMDGYEGNGVAGAHNMGVFDFEDYSITPYYKSRSTSLHSSPVWIVPP